MSVSFRAALRFPDQLHQTSLDVFWSTGKNFSRGFLQYGLHVLPLFLGLGGCHTMKSFLQHGLEIVFHPWVTKFVHLQFLRLGTFPLGRRLEGKGDQCSSLRWASLWCVVRLSCHAAELRRSPRGASVWSGAVSMLP